MLTVVFVSLSGGQGKTTLTVLLGRYLARLGWKALLIDADPQHNLSDYLGFQPDPTKPTLFEVFTRPKKEDGGYFEPFDCIHYMETDDLYLIPADNGLGEAESFLMRSGFAGTSLQRRLQGDKRLQAFDVCLIDSPPQRSQFTLATVGAADAIVIPIGADIKGYGSLIRTKDVLDEFEREGFHKPLLGVVPFRENWKGRNLVLRCRDVNNYIREELGMEPLPQEFFRQGWKDNAIAVEQEDGLLVPSIPVSNWFDEAISQRSTLKDLGHEELEKPLEVLSRRIEQRKSNVNQ